MKNSRKHAHVIFDSETLRRAIAVMLDDGKERFGDDATHRYYLMKVDAGEQGWQLDTIDELLDVFGEQAASPNFVYGGFDLDVFGKDNFDETAVLDFTQFPSRAVIAVTHTDRAVIARVHEVFASAAPGLFVPPPAEEPHPAPRPRIFIGHGGSSSAWRHLKDHLQDQHGFEVEAYETGTRAGHTIRDILEQMLGSANFAILVFTAEDEQADGSMRARQNVVHEAGLFQGRLGFARAIVVLQEGVENLSNLEGVQYLPFTHHIKETFGDIVATINREFG